MLALTLPVARAHGFRFTRLVREPGARGFLPRVFSILSAHAAPKLRAAGIDFADAVFGLQKSGRMDLDEVRRAVRHAATGTAEIYFHPGAEEILTDPTQVAEIVRCAAEKL